jgi:hypothetical protein
MLLNVLHTLLVCGDIGAAVVASAGIVWETKDFGKAFADVAHQCVLFGVVLETLFTVGLFMVEEQQTQIAGEIASKANERAAILGKEAAQLQDNAAMLDREVGRRHLDGTIFSRILGNGPKGEFEIVYGAEDLDSLVLAFDLRYALERAGWRFISSTPVPLATLLSLKDAKSIPQHIKIQVHSFVGNEMPILSPKDNERRTLYSVLSGAIMVGLGGVQILRGGIDPTLPDNRVRITIFPR